MTGAAIDTTSDIVNGGFNASKYCSSILWASGLRFHFPLGLPDFGKVVNSFGFNGLS